MIRAVLFDLDGTLLPMDQDLFLKYYFMGISYSARVYCDPGVFMKHLSMGVAAMIGNTGTVTNEDAFWSSFTPCGADSRKILEPVFEKYYADSFADTRAACGFDPASAYTVRTLREMGVTTVLATNPLFPRIATEQRIGWAGLDSSDFTLVTTYENISYCKPNPDYYREIVTRLGLLPEECLMVGNDVSDDMVARNVGLSVFLLTPCLINKDNLDVSSYPSGDLHALTDYIADLVRK